MIGVSNGTFCRALKDRESRTLSYGRTAERKDPEVGRRTGSVWNEGRAALDFRPDGMAQSLMASRIQSNCRNSAGTDVVQPSGWTKWRCPWVHTCQGVVRSKIPLSLT